MPPPSGHDPRPGPLAYLLTFTCYGTRLHGNPPYRVHRMAHGTVLAGHDPNRVDRATRNLRQSPYILDHARREIVCASIEQTAAHRGWTLHAAHVRQDHVHAVIAANTKPERILTDLKAYASRQLTESGFETSKRLRWTRHGSTRYLYKEESLIAAVRYVIHQLGQPMSVYIHPGRIPPTTQKSAARK